MAGMRRDLLLGREAPAKRRREQAAQPSPPVQGLPSLEDQAPAGGEAAARPMPPLEPAAGQAAA
eukprot:14292504-Alexandrium_andersonii.AAC.1